MDYLTYAYLQTGQDQKALGIFEELKALAKVDPPSPTTAYAATAIPARILLERRLWSAAANLTLPPTTGRLTALTNHPWAIANIYFANAVGAARSDKIELARDRIAKLAAVEQKLKVPPGEYDWRKQIQIERQIAEAWLAKADGRVDDATRLMRNCSTRFWSPTSSTMSKAGD